MFLNSQVRKEKKKYKILTKHYDSGWKEDESEMQQMFSLIYLWNVITQLTFACSKLIIKTLKKCVKYIQSQQ